MLLMTQVCKVGTYVLYFGKFFFLLKFNQAMYVSFFCRAL
jgi:hypothetical protein